MYKSYLNQSNLVIKQLASWHLGKPLFNHCLMKSMLHSLRISVEAVGYELCTFPKHFGVLLRN